ncbi:AAA family ATPase [Abiotrophia defectiva]
MDDKGLHFGKITLFTGLNGSGKTTILNIIANKLGIRESGGSRNFIGNRQTEPEQYADLFRLVRVASQREKDAFYFRADTFYQTKQFVDDYQLNDYYGVKSMNNFSNGESFMRFVQFRLKDSGVYLFDEPEAALSPSMQMTLLVEFKRMLDHGCQLIIATHSPILLAYPGAVIYEINDSEITQKSYEETEVFNTYSLFINNYHRMIDQLLD